SSGSWYYTAFAYDGTFPVPANYSTPKYFSITVNPPATNYPPLSPVVFWEQYYEPQVQTTNGNGQATLTWSGICHDDDFPSDNWPNCPVFDIAYYKIYYKIGYPVTSLTNPSGYDNVIQTPTTNTSYTITGLTNGTTYYFWITAVDTIGQEGLTNLATSPLYPLPKATPSACGDGVCSPGETCAADNSACSGVHYICQTGTYTCSGGTYGSDGCKGSFINNSTDAGYCDATNPTVGSPRPPAHCCWDGSGGAAGQCRAANITCPF
ncbi:MAG: fibronectin type III domain-containing protein, partial [Nitrosarchaeum sp.]|nr:fibronectin type III domain-containing protein [Nitrosarchaeum sp.]